MLPVASALPLCTSVPWRCWWLCLPCLFVPQLRLLHSLLSQHPSRSLSRERDFHIAHFHATVVRLHPTGYFRERLFTRQKENSNTSGKGRKRRMCSVSAIPPQVVPTGGNVTWTTSTTLPFKPPVPPHPRKERSPDINYNGRRRNRRVSTSATQREKKTTKRGGKRENMWCAAKVCGGWGM